MKTTRDRKAPFLEVVAIFLVQSDGERSPLQALQLLKLDMRSKGLLGLSREEERTEFCRPLCNLSKTLKEESKTDKLFRVDGGRERKEFGKSERVVQGVNAIQNLPHQDARWNTVGQGLGHPADEEPFVT